MSTIPSLSSTIGESQRLPLTLVDLANRFGEIPAARICLDPLPGEATEQDLLEFSERGERLFELVNGTLIEKTMGSFESFVAGRIFGMLFGFLQTHPLGIVLPADGQLKIKRDTIRVPDVCFIARDRLRNSDFQTARIASVSPNLAVEVISPSNSQREMEDKLADYFATGSEEVWYVYPGQRELHQFSSPQTVIVLQESDTLLSPLLPGFSLPIASIFIDPLADEAPEADPSKKDG